MAVARIDAKFDPVIYLCIGCSYFLAVAGGSALVLHTQTGNAVLDTLDKDCALCLLGSAPPLPTPCIQPPPLAAAHNTPLPPAQVHAMAPMAAPPPARGPPSHPVCQT